jgi:glyoxylase-like metal-dependent hydrolase (beta-lactamase superfamily II)/8-oxo-dGTP pyrophosphatase MutT (NUDIX family)
VTRIPEAASVILTRGPSARELLAVRRAECLRFFGGFLAFPGGKVDADDAETPVRTAGTSVAVPRLAAAARELFEETGVLLARRTDGCFLASSPDLVQARQELTGGTLSFSRLLSGRGLSLHAHDFTPAGTLVTPPFSPVRFDTSFFRASLPPGQEIDIWPGELSDGFWTTPEELIDRWTRGEFLVTPPTINLLRALAGGENFLAGEGEPLPVIAFAPCVYLLPLHTVALPPTQYTNAYLVGNERRWLIDPGPREAPEQARLLDALPKLMGKDSEFAGVVLTHWHPDHVDGAAAVVERFRVPVLAHRETARILGARVRVDRFLDEGDTLDLGTTPDGSGPWRLQAMLTPGHAAGHLAFFEPRYRLLLAADLISTVSSVVIAPPDGDVAAYLESLRRVRELDCRLLLPGHGPPTPRARQVIDGAIDHRLKREQQLLEALADGPQAIADLADRLYEGLPEALRGFARLQVQTGLEKLRREGRAMSAADSRWQLAAGT